MTSRTRTRPTRWPRLMIAAATVLLLASFASAGGTAGASVAGGGAPPPAPQPARLMIASFHSASGAANFIRDHQLGWNECVLGKELGVLPPGVAELPEHCTAQTHVEVLEILRARVNGANVSRVVTRPIPADELWGPLTAYRLAGFDPVIIK